MNTITLYSNLYYDSGTIDISSMHYRWDSLFNDRGDVGNYRSAIDSEKLFAVHNIEADFASYFFNSVGISCNFTENKNKKDLVRLIDVGSCPDWLVFARVGRTLFLDKPFILFSSQEPCAQLEEIFNFAPNIFVMDISYGDTPYERHMPFPAFLPRMMNPYLNTVIAYHTINLSNVEAKKYIYNNLKYRFDGAKTLTQYFLYKHNLLDQGIVTYNRGKGDILSADLLDDYDNNEAVNAFRSQILNMPLPGPVEIEKYTEEDFIDWLGRQNNMNLTNDSIFSRKKRFHPIYVYNESYFSMINESNPVVRTTTTFSEKTLYPIMNGHPFIINTHYQEQTYSHLQQLGFELFTEILDYSSPQTGAYYSVLNCIDNITSFDTDNYKNNIASTLKTSRHNRENFTNTRSKLWTTLRKLMISHLEKYFDACNKST